MVAENLSPSTSTAPPPPPTSSAPPPPPPPPVSSLADDAKKGENVDQPPNPPSEGNIASRIIIALSEGEQAEGNMALPEVAYASEIEDEEGFFDMPYHAAPIVVLYPGQPFPTEGTSTSVPVGSSIPTADHLSGDVSDDDVPLVFKRKRSAESSSAPESSKRQKTSSRVLQLAKEWCMSPDQVEELAAEDNLVVTNQVICSKDAQAVKKLVQKEGGMGQQKDLLCRFDSMTMEQKKIASRTGKCKQKN
ncbi:hypothetical protein L1887_01935 [Cichorium endivia]|nr:hypothetical protein L1887_01935 [Cichorium endivia]